MIICIAGCIGFSSCCKEENNQIKKLELKLIDRENELTNTNSLLKQEQDKTTVLSERLSSYGNRLFRNEFAKGYIITLAKFGQYGMIELHDGNVHKESFIAFYDKRDLTRPKVGKKYFVKVSHFNGMPKVVEAKEELDEGDNLFLGTPKTNIDYHILSDHGEGAGWHKKGHRINNGYSMELGVSKLKVKPENEPVEAIIVPEHLREMARAISKLSGDTVIYYELDSSGTTFTKLDSVHRHGYLIYE